MENPRKTLAKAGFQAELIDLNHGTYIGCLSPNVVRILSNQNWQQPLAIEVSNGARWQPTE